MQSEGVKRRGDGRASEAQQDFQFDSPGLERLGQAAFCFATERTRIRWIGGGGEGFLRKKEFNWWNSTMFLKPPAAGRRAVFDTARSQRAGSR